MEVADALKAIAAALPDGPMPAMTLRQAQLCDGTLSKEITEHEWAVAGELDHDVLWTRVDEQTLRECPALGFLDDEGFVYYLPAFLSAALRQIVAGRLNDDLVGYAVFAVTNNKDNWSLARLKQLSDAQIDAVGEFLRIVRERGGFNGNEAAQALQTYWETPESRRRTLLYVP
jgi:hypothetical protein